MEVQMISTGTMENFLVMMQRLCFKKVSAIPMAVFNQISGQSEIENLHFELSFH